MSNHSSLKDSLGRAIYLDWNATTKMHPSVVRAMLEASSTAYGNPSSVHQFGRYAKECVEEVRAGIAKSFSSHPRDVIFTSGGTEANNLALLDAPGLVTSVLEHPSVTRVAEALLAQGKPVKYLPVTTDGCIDPSGMDALLSGMPEHTVVAVQAVNHETGVIQPLSAIAESAARKQASLHVDAVQAVGKLEIRHYMCGDSFAIAAHKIRGPKGVGAFVYRCGRKPPMPLFRGGSQQRGLRPGTLDPISILGFGAAWQRIADGSSRHETLSALRDRLEAELCDVAEPNVREGVARLSHVASLYVPNWRGEELVAALDLEGICISSGSACSAGTAEPSSVIAAMHGPARAMGTVRVSLGEETTEDEIDRTIAAFKRVVLRG